MSNRIRNVQITQRRWDAAEAELWVTVEPELLTPTTEVRGRLMGPRCPGITTVEVAYPLRALQRPQPGHSGVTMRVIIPDPVAGEPQRPCVHVGPVEPWQDGRHCDQVAVGV